MCTGKMNLDKHYRIRRSDPNNIVIEIRVASKTNNETWRIIGYHGNSPDSLISGLLRVVMANHIPKDVKLSEQLEMMQLELVSIRGYLKKIIEEAKWEKEKLSIAFAEVFNDE